MTENAIILKSSSRNKLQSHDQKEYSLPKLNKEFRSTVKGVKKYATSIENVAIEYLKNIVHRDQASLKLIITQNDKELFKQNKSVKNSFLKSLVYDGESFIVVSFIFFITFILNGVGVFNFVNNYHTAFETSLTAMIFLCGISVSLFGFISFFFFKGVNFMRKTGYCISIFSKIRSQKINNLAITDKAVYVSYKDLEKGLFHRKYEYREIAHLKTDVATNGDKIIFALNQKDDVLFEINCANENFEQVMSEIQNNMQKNTKDGVYDV